MRIEVHLERPEQLFEANPPPPSSPLYGRYTVEPALEVVRREVGTRPGPLVIDLVLPAASDADPADLTRAAHRWYEVRAEVEESTARADALHGRHTLAIRLVVFFLLNVLSVLLFRWRHHLELDRIVVETAAIGIQAIAWIVLWAPIEAMGAHVLDRRTRRRRSRTLAGLTIEVRTTASA